MAEHPPARPDVSAEARRERWSAGALAVVAIAYLLADRRYPLDTLATPGPGIFPLFVGLALLALAVWQLAAAGRVQRAGPTRAREDGAAARSRPPLVMCAVLVVYAAAMPVVGFLTTSFALVFVAARLMGLRGWWRPAALAFGVTAASHVVFVTWLGVPLPVGLLR
jgi:putative tricarboxylic transport membrane protein